MIFIHNNLPPTLALAVGMATSSSAPLIISAAANFETTSAMWLRSMRPTCCIPGDSVLVALALDMRRRRCHTRVQDNHQTTKQGVPFIVIRRAAAILLLARLLLLESACPLTQRGRNGRTQRHKLRIQRGVADERVTSGAVRTTKQCHAKLERLRDGTMRRGGRSSIRGHGTCKRRRCLTHAREKRGCAAVGRSSGAAAQLPRKAQRRASLKASANPGTARAATPQGV